jgi:predicted alpha/beta hydrolase family esterase
MTPVLIMPGIGGSGPLHWQSRWQVLEPTYQRVQVPDWDRPELSEWLAALDAAVQATGQPPVIVAHSLGCLAVAHWAANGGRARAALLVAVPDPSGPEFPGVAHSLALLPRVALPFPTRVVASRNDPYGCVEFAQRCAAAWGSSFTDVGSAGHINADSGLGDWAEGRQLLAALLASEN